MPEMLTIKGMHLGMQNVGSDEDLTFSRQMGLEYVDASPLWRQTLRGLGLDAGHWNADALVRFREHVESFGLKLAALHLYPGDIKDTEEVRGPSIIFKTSSKRDRDIKRICQCIEAAGKAGIPILNYWLSALEWGRSPGWTTGRGGIRYKNTVITHFFVDAHSP